MLSHLVNFNINLLIFTITLGCICYGQLDVGDNCSVARSGAIGTCILIDDCPKVIAEIVQQSLFPTSCGFKELKQIVCCPNEVKITTTTPAPSPTRISQKSKILVAIVV